MIETATLPRFEQQRVLEEFRKALRREAHNLKRPWVGEFPAFVWQQLYNRLQWSDGEERSGPVTTTVSAELARRCEPRASVWVREVKRRRESQEMELVLAGHSKAVTACSFSPDGQRVASAGEDGTVRLWDALSGAELTQSVDGDEGALRRCEYSPDGRRLLTGTPLMPRLLDGNTGHLIAELGGHLGRIEACAFSSDSHSILTAGDRSIRLWAAEDGTGLGIMEGHTGFVKDCVFVPGAERIISCGQDKTLRLWDAKTCEQIAVMSHPEPIWTFAVSPRGDRVISTSSTSAMLWDAATGALLRDLKHPEAVSCCDFAPEGSRVVTGCWDHTIRIWDAADGAALTELHGHTAHVAWCMFGPTSESVVSAGGHDGSGQSSDWRVAFWNTNAESMVSSVDSTSEAEVLALTRDRTRIAWSVGYGHVVTVSDASSGQTIGTLEGHAGWVRDCGFAPDGERLVSAGDEGTLRLWDLRDAGGEGNVPGASAQTIACDFSPDGELVASVEGESGTLRLWDWMRGAEHAETVSRDGAFDCCRFTPDGASVAMARGGSVEFAGVTRGTDSLEVRHTGRRLRDDHILSDRTPLSRNRLAFAPNGSRVVLAGGYEKSMVVWDTASDEQLVVLRGHSSLIRSCCFSPDGSEVLSAGHSEVKLWDVGAGVERMDLEGHASWVEACAWTPDGQHVMSAGDETLRTWNASTGEEAGCIRLPHYITAAGISRDCSVVVTAGDDGSVLLRDMERDTTVAAWIPPSDPKQIVLSPAGEAIALVDADYHLGLLSIQGDIGGSGGPSDAHLGAGPTCPHCGASVSRDELWCPSCGHDL